MLRPRCLRAGLVAAVAVTVFADRTAIAQRPAATKRVAPVLMEPGPVERSVLYADGREVEVATEWVWRPVCGSDPSALSVAELSRIAQSARAAAAAHPAPLEGLGGVATGSGGLNVIFNITSALPAEAVTALGEVERYVEAQFSDPVTVVIDFQFAPLSPGVLGATGSAYVSTTWANARVGLQAGMDATDTIQSFLPSGSTIPVRYNGNSSIATNEGTVFFTRANYRATVGTVTGTAAGMTFSSNFAWDYTPPDISPGTYCFQSVITHEVGHALGFVSGADFRVNDIEALDIYRFQRTESGGSDHNPDDLAEFGTTARMVDQNAPGTDDDVNSDLITVDYRMADGSPNQASHFRDQTPGIYVMDPAFGSGETFYPNFLRSGDVDMFDAIGWDYPATNSGCDEALPLKCNSIRPFDNTAAGSAPDPAFSCGVGGAHAGAVWFSFVATSTSAGVSTCGSSMQDSTLAVYSGICGALIPIACSEDNACDGSPGLASVCLTGLNIGETYYVQAASKSAADRGLYTLRLDCSCFGACCMPPPASCMDLQEDDCAQLAGDYSGPGTRCDSDSNADGLDDACERPQIKFSQLPTAGAEDAASNIDWSDQLPNVTVADDFTSDGRPIHTVRWWGSVLDGGVQPDGWNIGFHEPLTGGSPAGTPLAVYFCPTEVVVPDPTPIPACDSHQVIGYSARLYDCCLVHAYADSRTSTTPGAPGAFYEEQCLDYEVDIQAVVGVRFDKDLQNGGCIETPTATTASGDFWGWHTTSFEHGIDATVTAPLSMVVNDWVYGPWATLVPGCSTPNVAFELVTTRSGVSGDRTLWDNGQPNNGDALITQYGGELSDWMTVDDVDFPTGATITDLNWFNEEEPNFTWSGRVRIEIYPDNGLLAPAGGGGPHVAKWVPDSGGAVIRTDLGPGQFFHRYRYDVSGLNISLAAGHWWIGLATAANPGGTGRAYWVTSHTKPNTLLFFGGESYIRTPSGGVPTFQPWSSINGGRMSDMSFALTVPTSVDCNCNGVDDGLDILNATSADCNTNGIPDECESDCNASGLPDDCDIADAGSLDCQGNGVPDECDIFFGDSPDANGDEIPDECCEVVNAPLPEALIIPKNRFITIVPTNAGTITALRVTMMTLQDPVPPNPPGRTPQDFSAFQGTYRWVGPPATFSEGSGSLPPFKAARLQCTPYLIDWGAVGPLHIYGPEIMPSSLYHVQAGEQKCVEDGDTTHFHAPLPVLTARWGDASEPFNPPAQTDQPDSFDIVSLLAKFKGLPNSLTKTQLMLQPSVVLPGSDINALDIVACVDAFKGFAYPFSGPTACPP